MIRWKKGSYISSIRQFLRDRVEIATLFPVIPLLRENISNLTVLFPSIYDCITVTMTAPNPTQLNPTQPNPTQPNPTQLNSTQLNSTQLNSTQLNSTQLNSTQLNSIPSPV